jgi:hypothetical protein
MSKVSGIRLLSKEDWMGVLGAFDFLESVGNAFPSLGCQCLMINACRRQGFPVRFGLSEIPLFDSVERLYCSISKHEIFCVACSSGERALKCQRWFSLWVCVEVLVDSCDSQFLEGWRPGLAWPPG